MTTPATTPLHRAGALPLHEQIEQSLRADIAAGRLAPGQKLPPEPQFATQWGVNRGTLRRALAPLVDEGLLTAQRGRGTFVAPELPRSSIAQRFRSLSEDLADQGFSFTRKVLRAAETVLPGRVCTLLGVGPGCWGFELERVFVGPDHALAYLRNYLRMDLTPDIASADFGTVPLFDVLDTSHPIVGGRRTFHAEPASREVAAALGVALRAPVLHIEQVSVDASGQGVEYSDIYLDTSRVSITSELDRSGRA